MRAGEIIEASGARARRQFLTFEASTGTPRRCDAVVGLFIWLINRPLPRRCGREGPNLTPTSNLVRGEGGRGHGTGEGSVKQEIQGYRTRVLSSRHMIGFQFSDTGLADDAPLLPNAAHGQKKQNDDRTLP